MAKISEEKKEKVWKSYHGGKKSTTDPFGRKMNYENFDVDHILPLSKNGNNNMKNLIPLHPKSNAEKADRLSGKVNNSAFKIEKGSSGAGVLKVNGKKVSK